MFYGSYIIWTGVIIILINSSLAKSSFKFTNIKCDCQDVSFAKIETCKLSVIGRGVISVNMVGFLYKTPITNITANVAVYKRANGYRPFLYNITTDMCAFFANRNRYPVMKVLSSIFLSHSNMNHTCPYSGDIVVKDFVMNEEMFRLFPIPEGDYMLKVDTFAYNDLKATIQVFFTRTDSLFG